MEFANRVKEIRKNNGLTQEEFAKKLNVSRQAVSNWENSKNLPDLEIIIIISREFSVSLDSLILGEDRDMNDLTDKLISDGSETKRAKYNFMAAIAGTFMLLTGLLLLIVKSLSVEYIDAEGVLHENFFLIPVAFLFIFASFITFSAVGIKSLIYRINDKN